MILSLIFRRFFLTTNLPLKVYLYKGFIQPTTKNAFVSVYCCIQTRHRFKDLNPLNSEPYLFRLPLYNKSNFRLIKI